MILACQLVVGCKDRKSSDEEALPQGPKERLPRVLRPLPRLAQPRRPPRWRRHDGRTTSHCLAVRNTESGRTAATFLGKNCDGPCWNAGCKTSCQNRGDYCSSGPACSANAICARYALQGTCCAAGQEKPCCAVAAANKGCQDYAPTDQICPSPNGTFAACCNAVNALLTPKAGGLTFAESSGTLSQTGRIDAISVPTEVQWADHTSP